MSFLVNHCGPLPQREVYSTGKQQCGETLENLELVYNLFKIMSDITLLQAEIHVDYVL